MTDTCERGSAKGSSDWCKTCTALVKEWVKWESDAHRIVRRVTATLQAQHRAENERLRTLLTQTCPYGGAHDARPNDGEACARCGWEGDTDD